LNLVPLLNLMRLRYDALTYRWQTWVVGFDSEKQLHVLHSFFGEFSARTFAAVLLGSWALVLVPVAISLFRKRDTHLVSPLDKHYRVFCARMARLGLIRKPGETPSQFAQRASQVQPRFFDQLWQIAELYNDLAYADAKSSTGRSAEALRKFRRAVSGFKPDRRTVLAEETNSHQSGAGR
jgi:hypothetical protein